MKHMKQLMLGNEAVARGLYEAGVKVVSSYPGTPSTESPRRPLHTTKCTVSGPPMRR